MPDPLTDEERRLIDEFIASGRVYRAAFGEACDDPHASKRKSYNKAREHAKSIKSRQASGASRSRIRMEKI